jgi:hypothetical protein
VSVLFLAEFPLNEAIRGKDVGVEWTPFKLRPAPHPMFRPEGKYLQQAWRNSVYPMANGWEFRSSCLGFRRNRTPIWFSRATSTPPVGNAHAGDEDAGTRRHRHSPRLCRRYARLRQVPAGVSPFQRRRGPGQAQGNAGRMRGEKGSRSGGNVTKDAMAIRTSTSRKVAPAPVHPVGKEPPWPAGPVIPFYVGYGRAPCQRTHPGYGFK